MALCRIQVTKQLAWGNHQSNKNYRNSRCSTRSNDGVRPELLSVQPDVNQTKTGELGTWPLKRTEKETWWGQVELGSPWNSISNQSEQVTVFKWLARAQSPLRRTSCLCSHITSGESRQMKSEGKAQFLHCVLRERKGVMHGTSAQGHRAVGSLLTNPLGRWAEEVDRLSQPEGRAEGMYAHPNHWIVVTG